MDIFGQAPTRLPPPRYDEAPELYFDWDNKPVLPNPKTSFELTKSQIDNISDLLASHKIQSSPQELFNFFREAIEQREYSKFQFTRNLSDILSLIESLEVGMALAERTSLIVILMILRDIYCCY